MARRVDRCDRRPQHADDDWDEGIRDPVSRTQVETLDANIASFGAKAYFPFRDLRQGIVT